MKIRDARLACLVLTVALSVTLSAPGARAQNDNVQELINRIDRLQRELVTLQRAYYQGKPTPGAAGQSGPAQAGRTTTGGLDSRVAARLEIRLTRLETEIRTLTGKAEELQHAAGQLVSRLSKLVSDVDFRLRTLEQGGTPPATAADQSAPGTTPQPPSPLATRIPRTNSALNAPPQTLGTIPGLSPDRTAAQWPTARLVQPSSQPKHPSTPEEQYNQATSLLLNDQNFTGAESALKTFIKSHPKHKLTGNAHYWLGETYYVRKDYKQAAFTFADGYQRFPKSNKAPDNLLKLGMALGQLGQAKQACTAFSRLLANFPNVGRTLKSRIQRQRQRYQCR
jgi:tol-pal system protein YbgF